MALKKLLVKAELIQGQRCLRIVHVDILLTERILLLPGQTVSFQKEMVFVEFIREDLADFLPGHGIIRLLDTGEADHDHRIRPLQTAVLLLLPDLQPLEQIPLPAYSAEKNFSSILMFSVFPKRLGRVISVTTS